MERCEHHQALADDIKTIKSKLNGNGRPGILERISRMETKINMLMWITGLTAGAVITSILKPIIGG